MLLSINSQKAKEEQNAIKKYIFRSVVYCTAATAQGTKIKDDIILPGKNLYGNITKNVIKKFFILDSAQFANANENGYVFVKFKVVAGSVQDVSFLQPGLAFVKDAIKEALLNLKREDMTGFRNDAGNIYILPVRYRFAINGGKFANKTAKQILDKIPDVKQLESQPSLIDDFQSFINESGFNEFIGVKCYFLTPLEINRPVI